VFVLANFGTICAEFAGIGAVAQLAGLPTAPCVLGAAGLVVGLVLAASFHRVEHVLLALSAVLASYLVAGVLAQPDWSQAARGLVVPSMPLTTSAFIAVTATLGTTLAPWGLAFIQSYAADKGITRRDYGLERIEVVAGSLLTGIIGIFIVVACAATLATAGRHIEDARDAAQALRPLAGDYASLLFGVGLAGAGLLAAAIVPLATAYSLSEAFGKAGGLDDAARADRLFYGSFVVLVGVAATIVSLPHVPLLPLIYFSQLVNAILLAPHLVLLVLLNRDTQIMGNHDILSARWSAAAWLGIVLVVSSVLALGVALLTT
jgi:Mn2+/Fe2+ NRAMP family transporter